MIFFLGKSSPIEKLREFTFKMLREYKAIKILILKEREMVSSLREKINEQENLNFHIVKEYLTESINVCNKYVSNYINKYNSLIKTIEIMPQKMRILIYKKFGGNIGVKNM